MQELTTQLQETDSKLIAAQQALRQSRSKSPAKSQQVSASLASLDTLAPTQKPEATESTQAMKKLHTDSSQVTLSQAQGAGEAVSQYVVDDQSAPPAEAGDPWRQLIVLVTMPGAATFCGSC